MQWTRLLHSGSDVTDTAGGNIFARRFVRAHMDVPLDDADRERLAARADRFGFDSPEAYARTILETVLDELEADTDDTGGHDEEVQGRLEDLGYL